MNNVEGAKENLSEFKDGEKVKILCMLLDKKMFTTRANAQMCFVNFEDMTGTIEGIVFPKIYEVFKSTLTAGKILYIEGHISLKDEEEAKILVDIIKTAEQFVTECQQKPLCVLINSNDEQKIDAVRKISSKYKGNGKLYFYFNDLKKLTVAKNFEGIKICNEILSDLNFLLGKEKVAFIK